MSDGNCKPPVGTAGPFTGFPGMPGMGPMPGMPMPGMPGMPGPILGIYNRKWQHFRCFS